MNARPMPCRECPFRRDTASGQFSAERYAALRATVEREDGSHAQLFDPLFACHKSAEGREFACAGWLAVCGRDHVAVRVAVVRGELAAEALEPGPDLFASYDEMAATQASSVRLGAERGERK